MSSFSIKSAIKKALHVFLATWYGMVSTEAVWYEPYRDSPVEMLAPSQFKEAPLTESIKTVKPLLEPRLRFDLDITDPLSKVWVSFNKPGEDSQPYPLYAVPAISEKIIDLNLPNLDTQSRRFVGQYGGATFDFKVTFPSRDKEGDPLGSVEIYQLTSQYAVDFITNGLLVTHALEGMSDIRLSAESCTTKGKISAKGELTLRTRTSLLNLEGSSLSSPKRVRLRSQDGTIKNKRAFVEGNQVKIKARRFVNKQGRILSKNASFKLAQEFRNLGRSLVVGSDHLSITTPLFQNTNSSLVSSKSDVLAGKVYFGEGAIFSSTETLNLQASLLDLKDKSRLFSGTHSNIFVDDVVNADSFIESSGDLNIWVHHALRQIDGHITADKRIKISQHRDSLSFYPPSQDCGYLSFYSPHDQPLTFENIQGHIRAGTELLIQAPNSHIINQEGSFLGIISHIEARSLLNDGGEINAQKNTLLTSYFENRGGILAGDEVAVKTMFPVDQNIPGRTWKERLKVIGRDKIYGHLINIAGTITATTSLTLDTAGVFLNQNGVIQGDKEAYLSALVFGNKDGGQIQVGHDDDIKRANLTIKVKGDFYNQGSDTSIFSSGQLNLNSAQGKFFNRDGALVRSQEALIQAHEEISIDIANLEVTKLLTLETPYGRLTNNAGHIKAEHVTFNGQAFYNFGKGIIDATDISIKTTDITYNQQEGDIIAKNALKIEALYLDNSQGNLFGKSVILNLGNETPNDFYLHNLVITQPALLLG